MSSINLLIKPASSSCNLRCSYCFYFDEATHRESQSFGFMSDETMEAVVKKTLAFATERCAIGFQGGEPLLVGIEWYKRFVLCVNQNNVHDAQIEFSIQTNGILIDDEWAQFFAEHDFLVGVSLDGPKKYHDYCRLDASNKGTFDRVMEAISVLKKHFVDFNILTVVTERVARNIKEIYRFFMANDLRYHQFIPCLDPLDPAEKKHTGALSAPLYTRFLKDLFDLWYDDRSNGVMVYNRYFENLAGIMLGLVPESCNMRGMCATQYAIEADGSVYPCDFYMVDEYLLGNLNKDSLEAIDKKRTQIGFIERSYLLPEKCRVCKWGALCRGGCYRERNAVQPNQPPLNRYCTTFQEFFEYAAPRLESLL